MSASTHRQLARDTPARCAVLTISDTRTVESDESGRLIQERLRSAGHEVEAYRILPDEPERIEDALLELAAQVEVVLTTGGTGIARRDTTIEVADRLIRTPLPGFGELFRMLSYEDIGAAAMLSRATAGLYGPTDAPPETLLFCCPGSVAAVELAMDRLIVPELRHLVWEVVRQRA